MPGSTSSPRASSRGPVAAASSAGDTAVRQQQVHRLLAVGGQQHSAAGNAQIVSLVGSHGSKTICTRGVG